MTSVQEENINNIYIDSSKYACTSGSGGNAEISLQRNASLARQLASRFSCDSRVLDVGCATGELLSEMEKLGYKSLTGVEPSGVAIDNAVCSCRVSLIVGSVADIPKDSKFDLIVVSHVIEHVISPDVFLLGLMCFLNPGGCLYVEVPDASRYNDFYVSPYHYFDTEHINHFSIENLRFFAARLGLGVVDSGLKEIQIERGVDYPACYVYLSGFVPVNAIPDFSRNDGVHEYIEMSAKSFDGMLISGLAKIGENFIVFGCGSSTLRLIGDDMIDPSKIKYFVDNNPVYWGGSICGVSVVSPEAISIKDYMVVVPSKMFGHEIREELITKHGCDPENIIMLQ